MPATLPSARNPITMGNEVAPPWYLFFRQMALASPVLGTPASATAQGVAGQVTWDDDFLYVCIAPNTWKRVALGTW